MNRFESDYVKHIYLDALSSKGLLNNDEVISVLSQIDSLLESDYYKAELLMKMQKNYLKNETVQLAYLNAVKGIKSDYYKTEVIKNL